MDEDVIHRSDFIKLYHSLDLTLSIFCLLLFTFISIPFRIGVTVDGFYDSISAFLESQRVRKPPREELQRGHQLEHCNSKADKEDRLEVYRSALQFFDSIMPRAGPNSTVGASTQRGSRISGPMSRQPKQARMQEDHRLGVDVTGNACRPTWFSDTDGPVFLSTVFAQNQPMELFSCEGARKNISDIEAPEDIAGILLCEDAEMQQIAHTKPLRKSPHKEPWPLTAAIREFYFRENAYRQANPRFTFGSGMQARPECMHQQDSTSNWLARLSLYRSKTTPSTTNKSYGSTSPKPKAKTKPFRPSSTSTLPAAVKVSRPRFAAISKPKHPRQPSTDSGYWSLSSGTISAEV